MIDSPLATRMFSWSDQEAFALASGDHNPMHMDEQAARRTQAGAPVVHGVHGALWALERLCALGVSLTNLASLKAQFHKFIYLDREVSLLIVRRDGQAVRAQLETGGMVAATLDMKFGPRKSTRHGTHPGPLAAAQPTVPRALALADMEGLRGRLTPPTTRAIAGLFPSLCAVLGEGRVGALAQLSTLVGMVCPGLYSIFSSFSADLMEGDEAGAGLGWHTVRTDERFRLVWMEACGSGIAASVQAFVRPPPVDAPSMVALAARVVADEFAGRTALVVGGSRGLGAVTAKLLATGGAQVFVTYATGKAEAHSLSEEIRVARGHTAASALVCDVREDITAQLGGLPAEITHLYYFATPRIFFQSATVFARNRFDEFLAVYVDGFWKVANWLATHSTSRPVSILYPSTVFVDSRPVGMTEYAMAKAAGETLAKDLAGALRIAISTPRIPRVLTDQTATVLPVETDDAVEVMLPLLRAEAIR